ncbi:hypothetical protein RJ640_019288 [Escallonia rubra]|uniref:AAA+ ATPase domain-containing protein n=1 Tax=Escallonia rubra TaxID=112253 RepID=A0AA88RPD7_9ASTE|nr:hypothetical protein RJ640_019288 [Escallonia rubra]
MSDTRGGGGDPGNRHLRKELTQIRKAARVLRDPGTTSSWRSPLSSSARSAAATAAANAAAAAAASSSTANRHHRRSYSNGSRIGGDGSGAENKVISGGKSKEKRVYLYNWRAQKSDSERSAATTTQSVDKWRRQHESRGNACGNDDDVSSSVAEESFDDSTSDARKNDSFISDRYASLIYNKCKEMNCAYTPSARRNAMKKKSKKGHQKQIVVSRSIQSDDIEEYFNSEDLRRISGASPLLSRLKSAKFLRGSGKEDSSYSYSTPALSTSSFNRYGVRDPSTVGSWDATTESLNGGDDDEVDDQLHFPGRHGCGIPCYWSKRSTPKRSGRFGSGYSPSFSDTLRRTGSSMLCGSQSVYHRRRRGSSLGSNNRRLASRAALGLIPLLTSSGDGQGGSSVATGQSDDELSTNYGGLDLEALSRLDGRRWSSSCRSQEGLELVAVNRDGEEESMTESIRTLSQKYRPMFFEELVGQNIVVQSLMNAILRGRVASLYLFQGPRGTGKTSTARVLAAALNCLASNKTKPCGVCRECSEFISGKSRDFREFDGSNKKGIDRVRYLLKTLSVGPSSAFSRYKVFVIDECHLLPSKTWLSFLKFLEVPLPRIVFIFITTDLDNVPRTVLSRCQKYLFNKIKDDEIVTRLGKIAADEDLDIESDALDLIALNADGSLRDAETMLDQLSLLGKKITTSLVNELVGVVSDEKLMELLELAMSSDTAETVKRARELMDSGVDPMVLTSQLATLIMDVISGTYHIVDARYGNSSFGGRSLNEAELERLKHALKLLSEAEKQLRVSSERSTWFTATLLQLGSVPSPDPTHSGSSRRQSSKTTEEDPSSTLGDSIAQKERCGAHHVSRKSTSPMPLPISAHRNSATQEDPFSQNDAGSFNPNPTHSQLMAASAVSHDDFTDGTTNSGGMNLNMLNNIWVRCIERCHSKTLRQLLHTYGKLVSISEVAGVFVAYIAFGDREIKNRAERFLSSITNSFETVLRSNIEIRIILLPEVETYINSSNPVVLPDSLDQKQINTTEMNKRATKTNGTNAVDVYSDHHSHQESLKVSRGSFNDEGKLGGSFESIAGSVVPSVEGTVMVNGTKEKKPVVPVQRIESIIHEQRLETAWLQATEKGTPGSRSRLKPERNQVLPQDGVYHYDQVESVNSMKLTSHNWEDDLNSEINALKIIDGKALQKDQIDKRLDHYPTSPSLLHDSSFISNFSKENTGYESGSGAGGCSGLLCWNNAKNQKRGKIKQGTPLRSTKRGRFLWFGECAKSRRTKNRFRR